MTNCHRVFICWCVQSVTLIQTATVVSSINETSRLPVMEVNTSPVTETPANQLLHESVTMRNRKGLIETLFSKYQLLMGSAADFKYIFYDTQSCRNACGDIKSFPCSCDLKCLVHNNCCEDMVTACPDVLKESRLRYGHMLNIEVDCARENVFLITECDKVQVSRSTNTRGADPITGSRWPITTALSNNKVRSLLPETAPHQFVPKQNDININDILAAMESPYVTDTTTGFVYKNMEIFSCAALNNSNPVMWEVSLSGDTMTNALSLEGLLRKGKRLFYSPPDQPFNGSEVATCTFESIGTCQETYLKNKSDLQYKCQLFISYVSYSAELTYNNRYCEMCNNVSADKLNVSKTLTKTNFHFSLTMTLVGSSLKVSATRNVMMLPLNWESASCELSQPVLTYQGGDTGLCTQRCYAGSVKGEDGVCMNFVPLLIAISDDYYPLTVDECNAFPALVRCFLKAHVKMENEFSPTIFMFDDTRKIRLYATQMFVHKTNYSTNLENHLIPTISLMTKTFKVFRRLRINVSRVHNTQSNATVYIKVNSFHVVNLYNEIIGHPHRLVVDRRNITLTCILSDDYKPFAQIKDINNNLHCVSAPLFEGDEDIISRYLDSTCFSVFDLKNGKETLLSHVLLIYVTRVLFLFV